MPELKSVGRSNGTQDGVGSRSVDAEAFTWTDRSPGNGIGVTCHAMRVRLKRALPSQRSTGLRCGQCSVSGR